MKSRSIFFMFFLAASLLQADTEKLLFVGKDDKNNWICHVRVAKNKYLPNDAKDFDLLSLDKAVFEIFSYDTTNDLSFVFVKNAIEKLEAKDPWHWVVCKTISDKFYLKDTYFDDPIKSFGRNKEDLCSFVNDQYKEYETLTKDLKNFMEPLQRRVFVVSYDEDGKGPYFLLYKKGGLYETMPFGRDKGLRPADLLDVEASVMTPDIKLSDIFKKSGFAFHEDEFVVSRLDEHNYLVILSEKYPLTGRVLGWAWHKYEIFKDAFVPRGNEADPAWLKEVLGVENNLLKNIDMNVHEHCIVGQFFYRTEDDNTLIGILPDHVIDKYGIAEYLPGNLWERAANPIELKAFKVDGARYSSDIEKIKGVKDQSYWSRIFISPWDNETFKGYDVRWFALDYIKNIVVKKYAASQSLKSVSGDVEFLVQHVVLSQKAASKLDSLLKAEAKKIKQEKKKREREEKQERERLELKRKQEEEAVELKKKQEVIQRAREEAIKKAKDATEKEKKQQELDRALREQEQERLRLEMKQAQEQADFELAMKLQREFDEELWREQGARPEEEALACLTRALKKLL